MLVQPTEVSYASTCAHMVNEVLAEEGDRIHNSQKCFGTAGQPINHSLGVHENRGWYTRDAKPLSFRYYDADGAPQATRFGHIGLDREYDEQGRLVWIRGIPGPDGLPFQLADLRNTWDAFGRRVRVEVFDVDGNPIDVQAPYAPKAPMARQDLSYDELGRTTEIRWFDQDGNPATGNPKPAIERFEYDVAVRIGEDWKPSRKANLDADGKPMEVDGVAAESWRYNPNGRLIHYATFGADGELTDNASGFAGYQQRYNAFGLLTFVRFFDAAGEDAVGPTGCAVLETHYDAVGNKTGESCDGEPRS